MPYTTVLQKREALTSEVSAFYFKRPTTFSFFPGQYLTLELPKTRFPYDFTISSSPFDLDSLVLVTRNTSTDFKRGLFALQPGETVCIDGPSGGFYMHEYDNSPKVLLCGGIGITPFMSMIRLYAQKNLSFPLTLLATFPTIQEMLFYDELVTLEARHPQLHIRYSLTREKGAWKGLQGRISEVLLRSTIPDLSLPVYFVCGSPVMAESTQELLVSIGVQQENIRVEMF